MQRPDCATPTHASIRIHILLHTHTHTHIHTSTHNPARCRSTPSPSKKEPSKTGTVHRKYYVRTPLPEHGNIKTLAKTQPEAHCLTKVSQDIDLECADARLSMSNQSILFCAARLLQANHKYLGAWVHRVWAFSIIYNKFYTHVYASTTLFKY